MNDGWLEGSASEAWEAEPFIYAGNEPNGRIRLYHDVVSNYLKKIWDINAV